jgi:uncharacterized coiled-coil protein SlyX
MADYEAIRKDLYERFHDAFEKLYISELKDQIADKNEIITANDHVIADQQAEIERLRAALRSFACKCTVKGMGAGGNCTRGTGECDCWNARAALGESK